MFSFISWVCIFSNGNEFLKNYPFDKRIDEMEVHEQVFHGLYNAQINGIRSGNAMTVMLFHQSGFDSTIPAYQFE